MKINNEIATLNVSPSDNTEEPYDEHIEVFQKTLYTIMIHCIGVNHCQPQTFSLDECESLSSTKEVQNSSQISVILPRTNWDDNMEIVGLEGDMHGTVAVCDQSDESSIVRFVNLAAGKGALVVFIFDVDPNKRFDSHVPVFSIPKECVGTIRKAAFAQVKFLRKLRDSMNTSHQHSTVPQQSTLSNAVSLETSPNIETTPDTIIPQTNSHKNVCPIDYIQPHKNEKLEYLLSFKCFSSNSKAPTCHTFNGKCFDGHKLPGKISKVTTPVVWKDQQQKIHSLSVGVKGNAVICTIKKFSELVVQYIDKAIEMGAIAVFLTDEVPDNFRCLIPIFIIPKEINDFIQRSESTTISFELLSSVPVYNLEDQGEFNGMLPSSYHLATNVKYAISKQRNTQANTEVRSYAAVTCTPTARSSQALAKSDTSSGGTRVIVKNQSTKDVIEEKPDDGGIVDYLVSGLKRLIPQQAKTIGEVVNELFGISKWDDETYFRVYREAIVILEKALSEKNNKSLVKGLDVVKLRLQMPNSSPLFFAFAACFHNALSLSNVYLVENKALGFAMLAGLKYSMNGDKLSCLREMRDLPPTKMPRNTIHLFFQNYFHGQAGNPCVTLVDSVLLDVFVMWHKCGLFEKRKVDLWKKIQNVVDSGFYYRNKLDLKVRLGCSSAESLGMLTQKTLEGFADVMLDLRESSNRSRDHVLLVEPFIADYMTSLVITEVKGQESKEFATILNIVFVTLNAVRFVTSVGSGFEDSKASNKVLCAIIGPLTFRKTYTLQGYMKCFMSVSSNHSHFVKIVEMLSNQLLSDLELSVGPSFADIGDLLASPGSLLVEQAYRNLPYRFENFLSDKFSSPGHFAVKLELISKLHDIFVSEKETPNSFGQHLISCLNGAVVTSSPHEVLASSVQLAVASPNLFSAAKSTHFRRRVVMVILGIDVNCLLADNAALLMQYFSGVHVPVSFDTLIWVLTDELQNKLLKEGTIVQACTLLKVVADSMNTARLLAQIATAVFAKKFEEWRPQSIRDFISIDDTMLTNMIHGLHRFRATSQGINECFEISKRLLEKWIENFDDNCLSKNEMNYVLNGSTIDTWRVLSSLVNGKLPEIEALESKLKTWNKLQTSLSIIFVGPYNGTPLGYMLKFYRCDQAKATQLGRLIRDLIYPTSNCKENVSLKILIDHLKYAESFIAENKKLLYICDYFVGNESILFNDSFIVASSRSFEDLVYDFSNAIKELGRKMGPSSSYEYASKAACVVRVSQTNIDHEMNVLLNCRELSLTNADIEIFLTMSLISNMSESMVRFVNGCRQFKFEVTSDDAFEVVDNITCVLKPGCNFAVDEFIDFAERLHSAFRPGTVAASLQELRESMEQLHAPMKIIAVFSLNSEVWTFIRDMLWFGEEGLKRFYKEYENITNVMVGSTASYEMSVLDSLGPVVRIVSPIGCLVKETKLNSLLNNLLSQKHLFEQLQTSDHDVAEVQKNVSLIREWFCHGVDDVSGVFNVFKAIRNTGTFSIFKSIVADCKRNRNKYTQLRICYNGEDGREQELCEETLDEFVHQIGLIQHESEYKADIQGFLDQYQLMVRAKCCISEMESVGFKMDMWSTWTCPTGGKFIDESRQLLHRAMDSNKSRQNWISLIRKKHPWSLLFWNDELADMYQLLVAQQGDTPHHHMHELTLILSRTIIGLNTMYNTQITAARTVTCAACQDLEEGSSSWLEIVSKCTSSYRLECGADTTSTSHNRTKRGQMVLHTLSCDMHRMAEATLRVLTHIYNTRLPSSFEVLDAEFCSGLDDLSIFLDRAMHFSNHIFAIFNVEHLTGSLIEILLAFLSNQDIKTEGVNFHVLQREGSCFHPSPWVHGRVWDMDALNLDGETADGGSMIWRESMIDGNNIQHVTVMSSEYCGTGKTFLITRKLESFVLERAEARVGVVSVHEGTTYASLVEDLRHKFSTGIGDRAVHFILTTLPTDTARSLRLLRALNHFFFSLLALRQVRSESTGESFYLDRGKWHIFIEFPSGFANEFYVDWIQRNTPVLGLCVVYSQPHEGFLISDQARRVCTYLRAYTDGTINRKFEQKANKQILFVLDKSGSMGESVGNGQTALSTAISNALRIIDSHVCVGDTFGVVMFDHNVSVLVAPNKVVNETTMADACLRLDNARFPDEMGGTMMYTGLGYAINAVQQDPSMESWIICLTDGCSADSCDLIRHAWTSSAPNTHLVIVGVNLPPAYEETMRLVCRKFLAEANPSTKGFFVRSEADFLSMNEAFTAVSRCLPVSMTFELDGVLSDEECRVLVNRFLPEFIPKENMLLHEAWIKFLYRRVKVFDDNNSFNFNETHDHLGSTLMEVMLSEVERFLSVNQSHDWIERNYAQLIYDFAGDSPEFRLLCTAPDRLNAVLRNKLESLDLPGFQIPSTADLQQIETLHQYLSQAMSIPLSTNSKGEAVLSCIEDSGFVLTLDFAVKLLLIHERVECRLPVILEGETGVSKTALTKMYSILRNYVLAPKHQQKSFFEINIDSSLTENDLVGQFERIRIAARDSLSDDVSIVVFLDEINTSSIIGFLKGIIVDHRLAGDKLETNIIVVSACNPARTEATTNGQSSRESDLG